LFIIKRQKKGRFSILRNRPIDSMFLVVEESQALVTKTGSDSP
jgi:hypothetical protein